MFNNPNKCRRWESCGALKEGRGTWPSCGKWRPVETSEEETSGVD